LLRGAPKHFGSDDNTADGQRVESQSRDAASLNPFRVVISISLAALSPTSVFVIRIEGPLDVTVQGFHDADASEHCRPVIFGDEL
jgi:hypothetical protein